MKMPISMPLPRKKMPSPMPMPTRKMPRILILMPLVALTLGFSDSASAAAKEDARPKSAKGHVRSYPTEIGRVESCLKAWNERLVAAAKDSEADNLREVHIAVNKEMVEELASLHRFLNPSTLPVAQPAPSDFESDEEEKETLDASASWAKNHMENLEIWLQTGVNPAAKKTHKRASSVSIASTGSEEEDSGDVFRRNHASVKEAIIATFLDLAQQVDVKKVAIARKGTLV